MVFVHSKQRDLLARIYRAIVHFLVCAVYKPEYTGFENIPATGAAILISNHVSYMDGPLIDAGCKRKVRYVIDESIYNLPGIHHLMDLADAIPITSNRKSVEAAFEEISRGLKNGDLICIFPEGYLTFTGSLGRFRQGVECIIRRDPVPVVPISISGLWGSVFSRKYRRSWKRLIPRNPFCPVVIKCGCCISPEHANVNHLQEVVLKLKYSEID